MGKKRKENKILRMPHPRIVFQILCYQRDAQAANNADITLLQTTGPIRQQDDDDEKNHFLLFARYFRPYSTQIHNIYRIQKFLSLWFFLDLPDFFIKLTKSLTLDTRTHTHTHTHTHTRTHISTN